ncbi:ABC transporter ATP-binding protein [Nakamurella sp.]|uniref:ABC transporter ATP-binding protein n=1 Tax=Nakamurella sp. TaxID=1869182 RepID=UPI003B3B7CD5
MPGTSLTADDLVLSYQSTEVVHGVSVHLAPGRVTALVGPNGSGKSTLLRSLARLHRIGAGRVDLGADGTRQDAAALSAREFATRVTLLSQSRPHPSGLAVRDVVAFGRHPHRKRFAPLGDADRAAIDRALALTGLTALAGRAVDQLSGGELQRVWLATCVAQDTDVLLFDEPTNHLDLRYQIETLDLIRDLADGHGRAVGVVLHDLNQAAAVADEVVLLGAGRIRAAGPPAAVLTAPHLGEVYGLPVAVAVDPDTGRLRVEPQGRHHRRHPPARATAGRCPDERN